MTSRRTLLHAALAVLVGIASLHADAAPKGSGGKPAPAINRQKQSSHVSGTPEYANRVKQGKPTSTFFGAKSGEALTRDAWETGKPVAGRPQLREKQYPITTGVGPNGGFQKNVRVAVNQRNEMHGYPSGKEVQ